MSRRNHKYSENEVILMNTFRKLWEQHVMWTRSFIISTAEELGDLQLVTARLLQNPTDFANVLKLFYGQGIANEFKNLFEQHLLIAADLVNAAKRGDTAAAEEFERKWYENADDIVDLLVRINPHWDRRTWRRLFNEHLEMTKSEAVNRLQKNYEADIMDYDRIEEQALIMADVMSKGIIKQFM